MKTTLDNTDALWSHINGSALKTALAAGGGVYKDDDRPLNSDKEDVVIKSLPILNDQLQVSVLNVNIHVKDKLIGKTEGQQYVTNHARLKELASIAVSVLDDSWFDDYHFTVQQQTVMPDLTPGSHYVNIRIEFFNINT